MNIIRLKDSNVVPIRRPLHTRKKIHIKTLQRLLKNAVEIHRRSAGEKFANWIVSCLYRKAAAGKSSIRWNINRKTQLPFMDEITKRIKKMGLNVKLYTRREVYIEHDWSVKNTTKDYLNEFAEIKVWFDC